MKDFFLQLNQFRSNCILDPQADPEVKKLIRFYLLLMETDRVLDNPITSAIDQCMNQKPTDQEHLFHYLWFMNSYARYVFFILNQKDESMKLILEILLQSERLFQIIFPENNAEKRCLSLILVLNILRMTTYEKNFSQANKQYQQFKEYLDLKNNFNFDSYPKSVVEFFNKYGAVLQGYLTSENQLYFAEKLLPIRNKIDSGLTI